MPLGYDAAFVPGPVQVRVVPIQDRHAGIPMTRTRPTGRLPVVRALLLAAAFASASAFAQGSPAGNAEAGKAKASMCIGCHEIPGYKASFPSVYSVPMITGQSACFSGR